MKNSILLAISLSLFNPLTIYCAERNLLMQPLMPTLPYPAYKIPSNDDETNHSQTINRNQCTRDCCPFICSLCTLGAVTATPLIVAQQEGFTIGVIPSVEFCAEHWVQQCKTATKQQRCACACLTLSAITACGLFKPFNILRLLCVFGPCNYSVPLDIGTCMAGARLFTYCLGKLSCTRQVGRSTGSLLGKIADKLNSCLPSCLQPQTISNCMEERFGIIWQDEESRIQAGLSILERSLTHKLAQIRTDASFADFVTSIEQLLYKIEAAKVGHAAENCEAILQEHVQLAEDINQATVKMYQQAQQAEQAEVQELRGTMAEHAIILRTLQQRLQREAATPASPMTAAEYVVVQGGGASPERDGDAGVAEDTHSKTA